MFWFQSASQRKFEVLLSIVGALIITGCSLFGQRQTSERNKEDARLHLRIGTSLFMNRQYPAALSSFLKAEALDPENPQIQNDLAMAYFVREKMDLAQEHIDRALALDPKYTEARNNRARILIDRGRYDEAIAEAKKVAQDLTYPTPIRGWANLALAHFKRGNFSECRKTTLDALKVDRKNCDIQLLLGRSQLELGDHKPASDTLDRAISFCDSENPDEAYYFAGIAHYKLGRISAAVDRLSVVVKKYPEGPFAKKAESLLEIIK